MTDKRFTNAAIKQYTGLVKDGYYLRPEKFNNTTIYAICKNLNSKGTERRLFGEVNREMAEILREEFGFNISDPVEYFGKADPVDKFCIRHWPRQEPAEQLF